MASDSTESFRPGSPTATLAVVAVAALVRFGWASWVPIRPVSDSAMYLLYAVRLAAGNGYTSEAGNPIAFWPVGPSFFYSLFVRTFENPMPWIAAFQAMLGAATVLGVMLLARRWFSPAVAFTAGALLAVWPSQIQFVTVLASELLFLAVMVAAWYAWDRDASTRQPGWAVAAGLLLGISCFFRPVSLLLLVPWSLARLVETGAWRRTLIGAGIAAVVMAATVAPWTLRNYYAFGSAVIISTNGGTNLWMGNHPDSDGRYHPIPRDGVRRKPQHLRDAELGRRAREFITADPIGFVSRSIRKAVLLHDRETIGVRWNAEGISDRIGQDGIKIFRILSTGYWWGVLALALGGLVILARRNGFWRMAFHPAVLTWAYFAAIHGVIVIQDRYHFPVIPSVAMLAAVALMAWLPKQASGPQP
ncbi:MAG: glycosyltransferase family 39 protein [Deltaproteobacteria bacterium]|nr:glycosyltransferase family 39 protein [Deltaproteobacteria bacterium]